MEITTYERQASVPNGESIPVVFDPRAQPDEARFSAGYLPATARSLGVTRQAHLTGAAMLGRSCRPVYSVGPWTVVHTTPGEDVRVVAARYSGLEVLSDLVVIPRLEWDRRCRLGLAWAVRPVVGDVGDIHQAPSAIGGRDGRIPMAA